MATTPPKKKQKTQASSSSPLKREEEEVWIDSPRGKQFKALLIHHLHLSKATARTQKKSKLSFNILKEEVDSWVEDLGMVLMKEKEEDQSMIDIIKGRGNVTMKEYRVTFVESVPNKLFDVKKDLRRCFGKHALIVNPPSESTPLQFSLKVERSYVWESADDRGMEVIEGTLGFYETFEVTFLYRAYHCALKPQIPTPPKA